MNICLLTQWKRKRQLHEWTRKLSVNRKSVKGTESEARIYKAHFERFIVVVLLAFRCYTDKKEESRP